MTLTPEQIEAGWIAHDGGECPVDPQAKVSVMFREGEVSKRSHRAQWWTAFSAVIAAHDLWQHQAPNRRNDIIAYRLENPNG